MNVILETQNLILKPIQESDAEAIFFFFTDKVTTYMYPSPAKKIEDTLSFIHQSMSLREENKEIVFVGRLKADDSFVGCFGFHHMDTKTPELGVWIREDYFGRHLGLEGVKRVLAFALEQNHVEYLVYPVDRRNIASRNIPESLGGIYTSNYQKTNLSGHLLDIIEYHIYPQEPSSYQRPTIIFYGDSITDCNRKKDDLHSLGDGYVGLLKNDFPLANIINLGISGDKIKSLINRFKRDVTPHQIDIFVLLAGINDVWHHYRYLYPMNTKMFEKQYEKLIQLIIKTYPNVQLVLLEPFSFMLGDFLEEWKPMLDDFRKIIHQLAQKYHLTMIPLNQHFHTWKKTYPEVELLGDGIHPSLLGHQQIAKTLKPILRELIISMQEKK